MKASLLASLRTTLLPIVGLVVALVLIVGLSYAYQHKSTVLVPHYNEVQELTGKQWSFQEYSTYFRKLAEQKGAVYAFEVLKRAPFPPNIDLHLLGHVVGDMLYKQKGLAGMQYCTQDFRNACSHSIVVGYLEEHGEGALPDIIKTCQEAPGGRGAYTMCFHGLGHGILAFVGYDFQKTIAMCRKTGTPEHQDREYIECVGGATMEMMSGVHDPTAWNLQKPKYLKAADPLAPCDSAFMPDEVKPICYTYLTPHLFEASGGDLGNLNPTVYGPAMHYCDALPANALDQREACYGGFGKDFVGIVQGRDIRDVGSTPDEGLRTIRTSCALARNMKAEGACDASALAALFWGGENNPDASFRFCAMAAEGPLRDRCYSELTGSILFYLSGDKRGSALCTKLPEPYRSGCLQNLNHA